MDTTHVQAGGLSELLEEVAQAAGRACGDMKTREEAMKFIVFTKHPTYKLEQTVASMEERDLLITGHKEVYPNIPVYWQEINEG